METIIGKETEVKNFRNILGERMHFVPIWTLKYKQLQN